jgi:transforming growth factor-beta-induced protein
MRLFHPAIMAFSAALAIATSATRIDKPGPFKDVIKSKENLSKFRSLLEEYPDVYGALSWSRDFTLLAPSNDALDRVFNTLLNSTFTRHNEYEIRAVLQYHVLNGIHLTTQLGPEFQYFDSWLINPMYANVSRGQKVGMIEQSEDVTIVTSGMATRSTVEEAVSSQSVVSN